MKKYFFVLLAFLFISGCGKKEEVLNIYNWADYVDDQILRDFEKEFNCKINYDTYANNEEMLAKLQAGASGYDLVFPTGYMVSMMIKDSMLAELDRNLLDNMKYLDKSDLGGNWDSENKYSLPYMYGFTAIGYKSDKVTDVVDSWTILQNPKYKNKIVLLDDMNEVFGIAFKILGYSANDTDPKHLEEAKNLLLEQKKVLKKYETTMGKDMLLSGDAYLVHNWTGDLYQVVEQDSTIKIAVPKEGTIIFVDNACVPKAAPNKELAMKFINYLMRPEIVAKNVNKVFYASPIDAALPMISDEIKNDPNIYLTKEVYDRSESLADLGEYNVVKEKAWSEIKSK